MNTFLEYSSPLDLVWSIHNLLLRRFRVAKEYLLKPSSISLSGRIEDLEDLWMDLHNIWYRLVLSENVRQFHFFLNWQHNSH